MQTPVPAAEAGSRTARSVPAQPLATSDQAVAWQALLDDAGAVVLVLDRDGRVQLANSAAAGVLDRGDSRPLVGHPLHQVMPAPTAEELLQMSARVADTGSPLVLRAIINGYWLTMMLRPFVSDEVGRPRVLITARMGHSPVAEGQATRDAKATDKGPLASLTPREFDVLRLVAMGLSTADVARHLFRSIKTIEGHRVSLGNKLGVGNRVELARIALRRGIVTPDQAMPA